MHALPAQCHCVRLTDCPLPSQVLDISKSHVSAHITDGMVYDQMGQMLSTVIDGRLFKEGIDFKVFDFADDGIHNIEDGISVNRTWLAEHGSEETLVRFLKARHPHPCALLLGMFPATSTVTKGHDILPCRLIPWLT